MIFGEKKDKTSSDFFLFPIFFFLKNFFFGVLFFSCLTTNKHGMGITKKNMGANGNKENDKKGGQKYIAIPNEQKKIYCPQ